MSQILSKLDEEILKQKYAALFHDTPFKALRIYFKKSGDEEKGLDNAKSAGNYEDIPKGKDQPWKMADRLSSAFDRFPLDFKEGNEFAWKAYKKYRSDNLSLYNIFSQTWDEESENKIKRLKRLEELDEKFKEAIRNIKQKISDRKLRYIYLWTWLDIWVIKNLGTPLPQDTRIPFFDILDHIYSTVSLVNLTYSGGYLILVDIPGIQNFIRRGRKLRDLYIGSWIISILMYKFLEKVALDFGPDTIITPTLRLNPFWVNSVIILLKNIIGSLDGIDIWKEYESLGLIDEDWYKYAIIPGTALLVLPKIKEFNSKDLVKQYIINKFYEALEEIINESRIIDKIDDLLNKLKSLDNSNLVLFNLNKEKIAEILRKIFIPKVIIIEVKKEEIEEYVNGEITFGNTIFSKRFLLWPELLKKLEDEQKEKPFIKITPIDLAISNVLDNIIGDLYENGKLIELCTNCGKLPAIIKFDRNSWNEIKINEKLLFKPGERLCIICLFKRLLSSKEVYEKIVKNVIGYKGNVDLRFPSTEDIVPNIEEVKRELRNVIKGLRIDEIIGEIKKEIGIKDFEGFIEEINKEYGFDSRYDFKNENIVIKILLTLYYLYRRLEEEGRKENEEVEIKQNKVTIEGVRFLIEKILEIIERKSNNIGLKDRILKQLSRKYYAIILADGDNIGDLIKGNLVKALIDNKYRVVNNQELLKKLVEEVVNRTMYDKKSGILNAIDNFIKYAKDVSIIQEEIRDEKDNIKVARVFLFPVSISYQFAVSRSLMISSLLEIKKVKKLDGFVVYAGGDDLMVLAPTDKIIEIINETRKTFSGEVNGWHKINDYKILGLGFVGRTYSVVIAHYKEPLNVVLEILREKENEGKKKIEYEIDGRKFKKNTTIYIYTRNYKDVITIPFKFNYLNNEFAIKYPLYEYLKEINLNLREIKEKITKGRIYAIIDEYKEELKILIEKDKEKAKNLMKSILEKNLKKEVDKFTKIIDKNIYIKEETKKKHVIFEIYKLLKILLREI